MGPVFPREPRPPFWREDVRGGPERTCFLASVSLMMLMTLRVALLHFFLLTAEDSSGSQVFQKCRAASMTRALLPARPPNLEGKV